ncbi:hypothetical protein V8F33_013734 [Rhypophila sp. PSN 637]
MMPARVQHHLGNGVWGDDKSINGFDHRRFVRKDGEPARPNPAAAFRGSGGRTSLCRVDTLPRVRSWFQRPCCPCASISSPSVVVVIGFCHRLKILPGPRPWSSRMMTFVFGFRPRKEVAGKR